MSSQLAETGRWDAFFNLAYKEHRETLLGLLEREREKQRRDWIGPYTDADIDKAVKIVLSQHAARLPYDDEAAKVRKGSSPIRGNFDAWDLNELGLYLILSRATVKERAEAIKLEAQNRIDNINMTVAFMEGIQ